MALKLTLSQAWSLLVLAVFVLSAGSCRGARRVFMPDLVKGAGAAARTVETGGSTLAASQDLALAPASASGLAGSSASSRSDAVTTATTTSDSGSAVRVSGTFSSTGLLEGEAELQERTHTVMLSGAWQQGAARSSHSPTEPPAQPTPVASPDWGGGELAPLGITDPLGLQKAEWDDYDLVVAWSGPRDVSWSEPQLLGGGLDPRFGGWYGPGYYGGYGMYGVQLWGLYGDWSWPGWYGGGYGYGGGYEGGQGERGGSGSGLPDGWREEMVAQIELELEIKLDLEKSSVRVSTEAD
ncbi:hypothetical protein CHLRE_17g724050v5 [Chlamydomonas reinhardtii]|uniref:Uncharacterized protein n=1 Tax=Chlamydomonas reinhardtii TaxID=3055 RepID=A8J6K4_CHLRE|nr:uncharacterized protein CHLRE_17g724050v5 [Chlamydomonas reinhardtii]PNW70535.1 hypothetical protein CHLRE_17g724050v5 [Chlamydomonas reinhardtii]|eukprot:XP_001697228.1 predicted protein [Chlamydomonas reinhardtii]